MFDNAFASSREELETQAIASTDPLGRFTRHALEMLQWASGLAATSSFLADGAMPLLRNPWDAHAFSLAIVRTPEMMGVEGESEGANLRDMAQLLPVRSSGRINWEI